MRPLDGLTILDLSRVLACPFASMILAELGARVIKVEQPGSGDETRGFEPQLAQDSAYYFACNRSKESITVDLRSAEGKRTIRALAEKADVLVENFPVGTLKRYGLDYPAIRACNERIVYVSCTGFGQSGPYRERAAYERPGGRIRPGAPSPPRSAGKALFHRGTAQICPGVCIHGSRMTNVSRDRSNGRAWHPLWNDGPARPNHLPSDGQAIPGGSGLPQTGQEGRGNFQRADGVRLERLGQTVSRKG